MSLADVAGALQTLHEISDGLTTDCSGTVAAWYNYSDQIYATQNGVPAIRITWTGLDGGGTQKYYVYYKRTTIFTIERKIKTN